MQVPLTMWKTIQSLESLMEAGRWFCYCQMLSLTKEKQILFAQFKSEISLPQSHFAFVAPCCL